MLEAVTVADPETLRPQGEAQFGVGRRLRELLQEIGSSADDRGIWLRDAKRALSFAVSSFPSMER